MNLGKLLPQWIKDLAQFLGIELTDELLIAMATGTTVVLAYLSSKAFPKIRLWYISRYLNKTSYYSNYQFEQAQKYYIPTRLRDIAPSNSDDEYAATARGVNELMDKFFDRVFDVKVKNDDKYYLILAESGMGKTTLLMNMYIRYQKRNQFKRGYDIEIIPLGEEATRVNDKITNIQKKENCILLLDAFDEDKQAATDYRQRLNEIIDLTRDFHRIVITCRTQFFPKEIEEPRETGIFKYGTDKGQHLFSKNYIAFFSNDDIKRYIHKKHPFWKRSKRKQALEIIHEAPAVLMRPMLLNYIDDLLSIDTNNLQLTQIYEILIEKWIEREAKRKHESEQENFKKNIYDFSRRIAVEIYQNYREGHGIRVTDEQARECAEKYHINLSELEWKSRSLLNRNADGELKFAHKSLLEYFLAKEMYEEVAYLKEFIMEGMEMAKKFNDELAMKYLNRNSYSLRVFGSNTIEDMRVGKKLFSELEEKSLVLEYANVENSGSSTALPFNSELAHFISSRIEVLNIIPNKPDEYKKSVNLHHFNLPKANYKAIFCKGQSISNLSILRQFKDLQLLDLYAPYISTHSIEGLQELQNLENLSLVSESFLEQTPSWEWLTKFNNLRNFKVGKTTIEEVLPFLPSSLKKLTINGCVSNDWQCLSRLSRVGLTKLELKSCAISTVMDIDLSKIQTLQEIEFGDMRVKDLTLLRGIDSLLLITLSNVSAKSILDALKSYFLSVNPSSKASAEFNIWVSRETLNGNPSEWLEYKIKNLNLPQQRVTLNYVTAGINRSITL